MYAIVKIGGHQYKVEKGDNVTVYRLEGNAGDAVEFSDVLMVSDGTSTEIGSPTVNKKVKAKIVEHLRGDKVIIFKKKRRKGYKVKNGHRQDLTTISIEAIA